MFIRCLGRKEQGVVRADGFSGFYETRTLILAEKNIVLERETECFSGQSNEKYCDGKPHYSVLLGSVASMPRCLSRPSNQRHLNIQR